MSPKGKRGKETPFLSQTKISAEKTAAEIQELLSGRAKKVMTEYEGGEVVAISFSIPIQYEGNPREIFFRLPVRWRNYFRVLERQHRRNPRSRGEVSEDQARRTAWRIAKAGLEADLARVDSEMVALQEILLPYVVQPDGQTLYERLESQGFKLLEHQK